MGMIGYFAAISAEMQDRIRNEPSLLEDFLFPDDGDGEPENSMDVDKAWHGIYHILWQRANGLDDPLAWAVLGGEEVGEDGGYGPARFLSPAQVKSVAAALQALTLDEFKKGFKPAEMTAAEIYPDIWEREGEDALDYLVGYFQQLAVFYRDTAARGEGAVLWIG